MKVLFFISSLVLGQSSFAGHLDCKVEEYKLNSGEDKYTVLKDIKRIFLFERVGNTTEETILGCDFRKNDQSFIQIKAVSKGRIFELSRCENIYGDMALSKKSISISTLNDHDAPEEIIDLQKVSEAEFKGTLTSNWDASETLYLTCKQKN